MEFISWNPEKNEWLKKNRGICFEDVVLRINTDHVLTIVDHPNQTRYPGQKIMIINVDGYVYLVPFELREKGIDLKTIFPSRKYTKKYLGDKK
ncbi:MAG: BrnT family toxin [Chitinivibrionales bacterium]|nr:BrnT family toxin [Chitinivibrionales bacterium]